MSDFIIAVAAAIVREGRVLAMRRAPPNDAGPGLWETVSGRLEPDEQPIDAIAREIAEETGLAIGSEIALEERPVDAYVARRGERPMCVGFYAARATSGAVRRSSEHDDHAWLTPEELAARGSPPRLVEAVRRALQALGESS